MRHTPRPAPALRLLLLLERSFLEVIRMAQCVRPVCRKEDRLAALITDGEWDLGVPCFHLNESDRLAQHLVEQFLSLRAS